MSDGTSKGEQNENKDNILNNTNKIPYYIYN